jgi:23S rRNA (cytosine1962-C5)-methyltransferase
MGRLTVTRKGLAWFQRGHPWIFRDDLEKTDDAVPGGIVTLETNRGAFLAQGFYSDRSKIAFRRLSRNPDPIGVSFWQKRIEEAHRYRQGIVTHTNAYRLVYGESDGLPSLIVDRYGDYFVVQTLSQGSEGVLGLIVQALLEQFHPKAILLRNDLAIRSLEGLPQEKKILHGEIPGRTEVFEGDIRYQVDLWSGQKTGTYLDQRENRRFAGTLLQGKVLDAFCYQGLFAIHAARRSQKVIAIDSSLEALSQGRENARMNSISHIEFIKENVFDFLKAEGETGERYDGIILDPPAFAKSRENANNAARGYKELNLRALRLLNPGGFLITASCSYNLSEGKFIEILKDCAMDSGSRLRLVERKTQSADHPILLDFPESFYLKCIFLQKLSS